MDESRTVPKLWGEEFYVTNRPEFCSKFLYIKAGYVCSMHRHPIKTECFHVMYGEGIIQVGVVKYRAKPGDTVFIPQGTWHCFCSKEGMTLLEISTTHSDADVERQSESHLLTKEGDPELWSLLYEQN